MALGFENFANEKCRIAEVSGAAGLGAAWRRPAPPAARAARQNRTTFILSGYQVPGEGILSIGGEFGRAFVL